MVRTRAISHNPTQIGSANLVVTDYGGSLIVPQAVLLRKPDDIVQPHTISPGHWGTSPLEEGMAARPSLNATLQSKVSEDIDDHSGT